LQVNDTRHCRLTVSFNFWDRLAVKPETEDAGRTLSERWPRIGRFENAVATNRAASVVAWTAVVVAVVLLWDWQVIGWAIVLSVAGLAGAITIFRAKSLPPELLASVLEAEPATVASAGEAMTSSRQRLGELKCKRLLSDAEFAQATVAVVGAP
jgi:hypothetical protein